MLPFTNNAQIVMKKEEMQQRVKCNKMQSMNLNASKDEERGKRQIKIDSIR
jgi:hypothetical protein